MNEDEFYFEESNVGQVIIKLIIFCFVVAACIFGYKFFKNKYTLRINNVKYEVGDNLSFDLNKYLKSKKIGSDDEYILELSEVPNDQGIITKAGEFKYTIEYKDVKKEGIIKESDTKAPVVETEDLTIDLNDEIKGDDFILTCFDYSKPCKVELKNESDYELSKKEGTYKIDLIIKDSFGNKTEKQVNLTVKKGAVKENSKTTDLTVKSISPSFKDYDGTLTLKYKKAISDDEIFGDELFQKLLLISGSNLHDYLPKKYEDNKIKEYETIYAYNKYGYVVGYSIRVVLDNNKVFYIQDKINDED